MLNSQHKNIRKGHQRSNLEWHVTRSDIYVENFMLASKTAQGWYYATLLVGLSLVGTIASNINS